jgi:hypothetical protein
VHGYPFGQVLGFWDIADDLASWIGLAQITVFGASGAGWLI